MATLSSQSPSPTTRVARGQMMFTLLVMGVVPLFFWLYTGQVWEDCLITFRASHYLATGYGLTYEPGVRVYSYTSPINALLLAFLDWLTRTDGFAVPLALYNFVAVGAFVTGGLVLQKLMREQDHPAPLSAAAWCFPVLLVLCLRTTAFVVNGQEAGFWMVFLAVSFAAVIRGLDRHWLAAGLGWAGLMWTRPDSPVHITILALTGLIWPARQRRAEFRGIVRSAAICAATYLPWFLGAWIYYGSPIPNSLSAKIGAFVGDGLPWPRAPVADWLRDTLGGAFAPMYLLAGSGWLWGTAAMGLLAAGACLIPGISRLTRCASAAYLGSILYLGFIWSKGTAFPWYFVPAGMFGCLAFVRLAFELIPRASRFSLVAGPTTVIIGFLTVAQFFFKALPLYAAQQELVDRDVRQRIGLWLREHAQPGDRVFLEPSGYIGYYSGALLYDYPGLTSPAVVRLRRQGLQFYQLIGKLQPAWLVLRAVEARGLEDYPAVSGQYRLVSVVDNDRKIWEHAPALARPLFHDSHFFILHRLPLPNDLAAVIPAIPRGR